MEEVKKTEEIKTLVRRLRIAYLLFWLIDILLVIAFECTFLGNCVFDPDGKGGYIFQTTGILFTLLFIPLSLKMFSIVLAKRISPLPFEKAIREHERWSSIRLSFFYLVVPVNIAVYYSTCSNIGLLCASIGLLASIFCWPDFERIKSELGL